VGQRAYIVTGPESSGNRYLVQILRACGCYTVAPSIEKDPPQPVDDPDRVDFTKLFLAPGKDLIAFHRSIPHGGQWVDLSAIAKQLSQAGYKSRTLLIMARNTRSMVDGQVRENHTLGNRHLSRNHISKAWRHIFSHVNSFDSFQVVPYVDLTSNLFVNWLVADLGLTLSSERPRFINGKDEVYQDLAKCIRSREM
jgi:hypothetical protein